MIRKYTLTMILEMVTVLQFGWMTMVNRTIANINTEKQGLLRPIDALDVDKKFFLTEIICLSLENASLLIQVLVNLTSVIKNRRSHLATI